MLTKNCKCDIIYAGAPKLNNTNLLYNYLRKDGQNVAKMTVGLIEKGGKHGREIADNERSSKQAGNFLSVSQTACEQR